MLNFLKKLKRNKDKKQHSRTSKVILALIIIALFSFTGLAMYVQIVSGVELSPTLTTCFYAFCTGELWMLATIKKSKLNNGQKVDQYHHISDQQQIEPESENEEPKG